MCVSISALCLHSEGLCFGFRICRLISSQNPIVVALVGLTQYTGVANLWVFQQRFLIIKAYFA